MSPTDRLGQAVAEADESLLRMERDSAAVIRADLPLRLDKALLLDEQRYVLVVSDAGGQRWVVPAVEQQAGLRRARPGDGVAEALVTLMAAGSADTAGFSVRAWAARPVTSELAVAVDQTNDSVVVGGEAVLKWLVHQPPVGQAHEQPAVSRLARLAAAGFEGAPTTWGLVTVDVGEAAPLLVATAVSFLPGAVDGWSWAVDDVRRLAAGESTLEDSVEPSAALGDLVARLHLTLATDGVVPLTETDAARWGTRALADLDRACAAVTGPEGVRLRRMAPWAARVLQPLAAAAGTPSIHLHGDLHVGQVLRHGRPARYSVVDFDGSPVLDPSERAARQPAAVDVAGMLASLDHVGRVVVRHTAGVDEAVVHRWIAHARNAFLSAYRGTLDRTGRPDLLDVALLRPLLVAQECREYLYAVQHLPHWTYVPDQALRSLLDEE